MISDRSDTRQRVLIALAVVALIEGIGLVFTIRALLQARHDRREPSVAAAGALRGANQPVPVTTPPMEASAAKPRLDAQQSRAAIFEGIPAQKVFPKETTEMPGMMDILNDPELSATFAHQIKRQFLGPYAELFRSLKLDVATSDKLQSILAERLISTYEVVNLSRDGSAEQVMRTLDSSNQSADKEIQALLGDEGYKAFSQYEDTLALRNRLKQLSTPLSFTNEPLTQAQMDAMVQAIAQSPDYQPSARPMYTAPKARANITPEQIQAAAVVLSPTQRQALTAELAMEAQAQRLESQNSARFQQYLKAWADQTGHGQ